MERKGLHSLVVRTLFRVVPGSIPGWISTFRRPPSAVRQTGESRE